MSQVFTPTCYGIKFQDGDRECAACGYRDQCRAAVFRARGAVPMVAPPIPPPASTQVPLPARPYFPPTYQPAPTQALVPATMPAPVMQPYMASKPPVYAPAPAPAPMYQPATSYYQSAQACIPTPGTVPNPLVAWQRPGAPAAPYYFGQYPGESIKVRLAKNVTMSIVRGILAEIFSFFSHWTWPPSQGNRE